MPSNTQWPTRRRFVASAAALLGATALAGCGGSASSSSSGSSREGPGARPPEDALVDPPHVTLRGSATEPNVVSETPTETDASDDGRSRTAEIDGWAHYLVASDEAAADLTFADVDGVAEAKEFLEETDFDSETVYVERHLVGECYRHRLCWVRWTDSEIETDYARVLRDADVACEADARVAVTNLIRLPVSLDPGQVSSYSSGSGGGRCRRPAGADEPTEVDAS